MHRRCAGWFGRIFALSLSTACGSGALVPPAATPSVPGARCSVAESQERPFIVEWDAASRNDLDALVKQEGLVVVRYSGCEMSLLRDCRAPGAYKYVAATRQDESISVRNEDELWAKLPLGAASLEGAVQKGSQLRVDMSIVGKHVEDQAIVDVSRFRGPGCEGATHVVVGLTTGAFEVLSGADIAASVDAVVVGGATRKSSAVLRRAGNRAACDASTRADLRPPEGCGALLRLDLEPVRCPPGARFDPKEGCVGVHGETRLSLGGPGGRNDPLDSAFASVVLDASHAVLATVRGEPTPPKTDVTFRQPFDEARKPFQELGPSAQFLLAECEIGFRRFEPGKDDGAIIYAHVQVHGDGQLRWGNLGAHDVKRSDKTALSIPAEQAPVAFADLHRHLVRTLAEERCAASPAMRREDWAYLRAPVSRLMEESDLPTAKKAAETCAKVGSTTGSWVIDPAECRVAFGTSSHCGMTKLDVAPAPNGGWSVRANVSGNLNRRD